MVYNKHSLLLNGEKRAISKWLQVELFSLFHLERQISKCKGKCVIKNEQNLRAVSCDFFYIKYFIKATLKLALLIHFIEA